MWLRSFEDVPNTPTKKRAELIAQVFAGAEPWGYFNGRRAVIGLRKSIHVRLDEGSIQGRSDFHWSSDDLLFALSLVQEHHIRGCEIDIVHVATWILNLNHYTDKRVLFLALDGDD